MVLIVFYQSINLFIDYVLLQSQSVDNSFEFQRRISFIENTKAAIFEWVVDI